MFCAYTRPGFQVSVYRTIGPLVLLNPQNLSLVSSYTHFIIPPRKLCLWEGILFSRCPKVPSTDRPCVRNVLFL